MKNYSTHLPLYGEVPSEFRNFINELGPQPFDYVIAIGQNEITFYPSVVLDGKKLMKAILPLKTVFGEKPKKTSRISRFATQFNMLASIAKSKYGKCSFAISLVEMPDEFPKSKNVLSVSLDTDVASVSSMLDNLFKSFVE